MAMELREVSMTQALKAWANQGAYVEVRIGTHFKRIITNTDYGFTVSKSEIQRGKFFINR